MMKYSETLTSSSSSIPSIPDDTSLAGALNQFDFLNDENTADEGNDTDSINSSWRGGLNASSETVLDFVSTGLVVQITN